MIICPACGADMHFSPSKQMLLCDYCDNTVSPEQYEESEGLLTEDSTYYETTIFTCPQCGGEIMNAEETAATFCSYCGASVQLLSRIGKEKKPSKIIPFTIDTDACKEIYNKRIKRAIFAPKFLRKNSEINKFRGIYMPYWSYGFSVDQSMETIGETSKREGDYIITDHYKLAAHVKGSYDGISFDSASNFDDDISESISPFETGKAKRFNPAYMSGFYADRGDVGSDVYADKAEEYLKSDLVKRYEKIQEFDDLSVDTKIIEKNINAQEKKSSFVLYPVWFLTNHFGKDRVTYAVVNGQTGKVAADIPIDPVKYVIISLIVALPIFMLLNLLPAIEPRGVIFYSMILHIICTIISFYQSVKISKRENHEEDKGYNSINGDVKDENKTTIKIKKYTYHVVILIVGIILFNYTHFSDLVYYGCCAGIMFCVALTFIGIIGQHNILTTHKPPQLAKRGGDENA